MKANLCGKQEIPLPIQYITASWDVLLSLYADYKEEQDRNICFQMKQSNDRIKEYFMENWKQYSDDVSFVKYGHYSELFESVEDLLWDSKENLIAKGFREIDIDLYYNCYIFDFEEAKKLLSMGANPDVVFQEDESIIDTIGYRASDYGMDMDNYIIQKTEVTIDEEFVSSLINAAAEKMYQLLKPHSRVQ